MRRVLAAGVIMLVGVSVVTAEEFFAAIIKVEGNKVTVSKRKKDEKPGEPVTLTAAENVKVVKGKFNRETMKSEAGDPIEGGLKSDRFSKEPRGIIITNAENVITEIRLFEPFKKKDDKKDDKN